MNVVRIVGATVRGKLQNQLPIRDFVEIGLTSGSGEGRVAVPEAEREVVEVSINPR